MVQADIGLIGLAVMGQNLVLNMDDHGYTVAVFNRTTSKVDDFLSSGAKGTKVIGTHSLEQFFATLKRPRKVLLMVKAGQAVDAFIEQCLPYLEEGDIIMDGGNSNFTDSNRRCKDLSNLGLRFIGTGVSGGEEGARHGPSIMPGGNVEAWPEVKAILQAISAKADGEPCCEWLGNAGAGHYVKMVHNGIEYGDMQLICESYQLMKVLLGYDAAKLHETFSEWNKGKLDSYLIEITADIFAMKDKDGSPLVDKILDVAGQKGTGKWTGINALDLGMPLTLIAESVFARCLSALKEERKIACQHLKGPENATFNGNKELFTSAIHDALYAAKIISYAQGFMLMREASEEYQWDLNFGSVALLWRGGCIIRSQFLAQIKEAFERQASLKNLLLDDFFCTEIHSAIPGLRKVVAKAAECGIPIPCLSTALSYYDGYRSEVLPANLLQAQRDYFGAHSYERIDAPRGKFFHTDWCGLGGMVSSTQYTV